jgi:hypothetical protein
MVPVKIVCCQWIRTTTSLLKGMGAAFMDQIVNNYLSKNKLDEGTSKVNNTNKIVEMVKPTRQWSTLGMRLMAISMA